MLFYTPPQLAKKYNIDPNRIRGFIEAGKLRAINLSNATRPRYRITEDDWDDFLNSCQTCPKPPAPQSTGSSRRRRSKDAKPKKFF